MLINPVAVIKILSEKVQNIRLDYIAADCPDDEYFANIILDLILKQSTGQCEIFEENILFNDDGSDEDDSDEESEESPEEESASSNYEQSPAKKGRVPIHEEYDIKTVENIVDYNTKYGPKATFKRYKSLKGDHSKLIRLTQFREKGGSKESKILEVKGIMYQKFLEKREKLESVHDIDLNKWALEAAKALSLPGFVGGKTFVTNFKKSYGITSRKITKFVTKVTLEDDSKTQKKAFEFTEEINQLKTSQGIEHGRVWNTDQSGFNYEMTSARTLSVRGERDTQGLVQSMNAMTHSYTLQVLISNDGRLAPKLFLCLQEQGGHFGPTVSRQLEQNKPSNVVLASSTSGKMSKVTLRTWISKCLSPIITAPSLLLQDSWGAQKDETLFQECLSNPTFLTIKTIPPKATKYIQPLDVYFFRQYKILARKLTDPLRGSEKLRDRVIIMRMHSFIYNQLSADIFRPMLLFAWQRSGYSVPERVERFENVLSINFSIGLEDCNGMIDSRPCQTSAILKCAHCSIFLCARHCLDPLHYH